MHDAGTPPNSRPRAVQPARGETVLIAYNPRAGARDSRRPIDRLHQACEAQGLDVIHETELAQIVARSQALWDQGKLRCVVAAGGDGTARLVAESIPAPAPLAVLPIGTENLLAKHLQYSTQSTAMAEMIAAGQTVAIDAAEANGKLFLVLASCGFDADVVQRLHAVRRGNINRFSYTWPLLQAIREYRYPTLRVRCDGVVQEGCWAFVFNVPQYALQLPIVDDATCVDGRLDVCTFRRGRWWNGVLYFLGVLIRQHRLWKDTTIRRAVRVEIEADEPVPYQLDGDPGGFLPLEIRVLPGRLRMIVSRRWLARHQLEQAAG